MAYSELIEDQVIDVVVIEDHPAFRFALKQVIERSGKFRVAGAYADGAEALENLEDLEGTVVLVDIELPQLDGLAVLRRLKGTGALPLVISGHTDGATVQEALSNGATGYLSKAVELEDIEDAVAATAEGRTVLSPVVQHALAEHLRAAASTDAALSVREQQVLRLAATGSTRDAIARALHVSEATVKAHLAAAYRKLGVSSRAAAIAEAQRRGIIPDRRHSLNSRPA